MIFIGTWKTWPLASWMETREHRHGESEAEVMVSRWEGGRASKLSSTLVLGQ